MLQSFFAIVNEIDHVSQWLQVITQERSEFHVVVDEQEASQGLLPAFLGCGAHDFPDIIRNGIFYLLLTIL